MTGELLIVGAGGLGRETAEAALAAGWNVRGFLDDDPSRHGTKAVGVEVLGGTDQLDRMLDKDPDLRLVICVAHPRRPASRASVVARLGAAEHRYATVIHPSVSVPASVEMGAGTILLAQIVLTADIAVGAHVVVMPQVVLTHDDVVEDYVTIAAGVRLNGGVRVGRGAYLGAGALIREGLRVGAGAVVGMGAVVLRDVPPGEVWAGNPARPLRAV